MSKIIIQNSDPGEWRLEELLVDDTRNLRIFHVRKEGDRRSGLKVTKRELFRGENFSEQKFQALISGNGNQPEIRRWFHFSDKEKAGETKVG